MHVDGFRFDLAATLARELHEVNRLGAFLDIIHQDPVLSQVKLIAEPWDLGEGGYQVGNFPVGWAEWNDRYRDTVRSYWKGDGGVSESGISHYGFERSLCAQRTTALCQREFHHRPRRLHFAGSGQLQRKAQRSQRGKESRREQQQPQLELRRGGSNRRSGHSGSARQAETKSAGHVAALAGDPMIYAGDAIGHTQNGNNNAYCQDNEISWLNWSLANRGSRSSGVRSANDQPAQASSDIPVAGDFFRAGQSRAPNVKDVLWLNPGGNEMNEDEWRDPLFAVLGMFLSGQGLDETDERGRKGKR